MVLLNARSIRNKWLEFQAMISTESVEIIGITETWVDTAGRDFEGEYRLPGYSLFHQDRAGRAGGGVMLYAKRHLNPVQIPIMTPYEIVGAEVRGSEPKVQVFVCYPPPNTLWMLTSLSTRLCRPSSGRRLPSWREISTVLGSTGKPI